MFYNFLTQMDPIWWVIIQGVILFLFAFVSKRKHLLTTLLSLEGLMLMIFMAICHTSTTMNLYSFMLIFLSLVACEGALGLSLLVLIVRNYSNDYYKSMNSLMC